MVRTVVVIAVALGLVAGLGGVAYAPYHTQTRPQQTTAGAYKAQARTAAAHASFASEGTSLSYVREHLGHAIACLEGPKGKNVNPAWDNPCQGQGGGVLVDLRADPQGMAWALVVQAAADLAVAGLKAQALDQAKNAARGVAELMKLVAQ
ncbi:MAG: hypothetical protein QN173_06030 [Armatimonadota bacterium]|nr:hypothetical protein [Armatimonadota bacterium]MDR7436174.1 hypothetical protein [Armatimonadota bacterium]MDR7472053.1 hypothetical protein [Armatimonadota bacterium]MDR7507148.1 hypothetical protein [Armatimonadota bacterium]MDR7509749.1 hypothetical protein [Armatimonadota bacterium]